MNNIDTSQAIDPFRAQPFTEKSLSFLQNATFEMLVGICSYIAGDNFDNTKGYVLSGLGHAGNIYFVGYVWFLNENGDQELFFCPGKDITGFAHAARLIIKQTYTSPADPATFSDGFVANVHTIRRLEIEDVVSGGCLLSTLIFCQQETITLRTKEIISTALNMDTTPQFTIAHGLTLSKIRSVKTMVMNNAGTLLSPLDVGNYATSGSFPDVEGRTELDATNIILDVRRTGQFDAAGYNAAHAYITIQYVD